jgi:hypothetical protein
LERTEKTDRIIQDQEGSADYDKFSIITIATSLFTYKKNQEAMEDYTGLGGETGQEGTKGQTGFYKTKGIYNTLCRTKRTVFLHRTKFSDVILQE